MSNTTPIIPSASNCKSFRRVWKSSLNILIIIGLSIFFSLHLSANSISLINPKQTYSLVDNFNIFETLDPLSIKEIIHKDSITFRPLEPSNLKANQFYWAKTTLQNQTTADTQKFQEWVLQLSIILTEVDVFVVRENGEIQTEKTGFFVPIKKRNFAPVLKANLAKIILPPNEKVSLYLKFKSDRKGMPIKLDASLKHVDTYFTHLKNRQQITIIFYGFVLMMLIYNLFLYFFARDKSYIYYSVYLGGIVAFMMYNSGDLAQILTPTFFPETPENVYYFKIFAYLTFAGYLAFIRSFLNLKNLLPRWDNILRGLTFLIIPTFLADLFLMISSNFNFNIADITSVSYVIIFLLIIFAFLLPLYKTKNKMGLFIIVGVLLMGLGLIFTLLSRFQTVDFSTDAFKIGVVLEIIVFSLGLAYRQKEMEKEQQEAAFELEKIKIREAEEHRELLRQKEINNLKSTLYTNVTHEFRTPLTVIMGMAEGLEKHSQAKTLILRNSQNLLNLINQMLDLAKLESGKLSVNWIQSNIIAYLKYLTESFLSLAMEKNIRLTFYSDSKELMMDFDDKKVQQIIYNLVYNAIKFTGEYGRIDFQCTRLKRESQSFLQIKIQDSGQGISEKELPHIFDRFHQGKESHQGTGIGLALTKELVELLSGEISVKSTFGEGTIFKIQLPITRNAALENPAKNQDFSLLKIESGKEEQTAQHIFDPPQLLLIEDNPDVVTYIKSILKNHFQISTAKNGKIGIQKAISTIPDIIISDVLMPEKDGFEVCQSLKNDQRTSHIPIILLTAKTEFEDKMKGLKMGAEAYLEKPFQKEELLIRLKKLVEIRQNLQERFANPSLISESPLTPTLEDNFIKTLQQIIEANLDQPNFGVPDLAKALLMSQIQVYRKLKALTNLTPVQFIRKARLKRAIDLLKTSRMNISEVAFEVGFNDPNYFSRVFQKEFGRSPSSLKEISIGDK